MYHGKMLDKREMTELTKGFGGTKGSWFGGESHNSVTMIEDKMLFPSILKITHAYMGTMILLV